jgi:hypothetical protein
MKKLLSIVALLSMLALASCNKETPEDTSTSTGAPSVEVETPVDSSTSGTDASVVE